jgi:hypothetical protein
VYVSITKVQLTNIANIQLKVLFRKRYSTLVFHPTKIFSSYMFRLVEHGDDKFSLLEPLMLLDCKVQNQGLKKCL